MILVLLGTQNNSFHRLLEEIENNIQNGNIQEKVIVQAGFTNYESENMYIFDMIPREKLYKLEDEADLIISHGGVGSLMGAIKRKKRVIAVPRLKKYGEHVNDHQLEIVETFKKQGLVIGISDVSELSDALNKAKDMEVKEIEAGENQIINIIDDYIQKVTK